MWAIPISLPSTLQLISSVTVKFRVDSSIAKDVAPVLLLVNIIFTWLVIASRSLAPCSRESQRKHEKTLHEKEFGKISGDSALSIFSSEHNHLLESVHCNPLFLKFVAHSQ